MDLSLSLTNRQISPAVVNVFQNDNNITTLRFNLDNHMYGSADLRNYKAYAVTSINGDIDMIELTMHESGNGLILSWQLQDYTTRQFGALQYQIVFKENIADTENPAAFYSYKAILLVRESINADDHITANYPTILKQWLDHIEALSGAAENANITYIPAGETLDISSRLNGHLYYQIEDATTGEGHFEDHNANRLGEFNAKYIANANLNTILENGEYICGGTISNAPILNTYCMVRVTDSASTNRIIQEVYVPDAKNTIRVFVRAITGSITFGAWTELASSGRTDALINDRAFELDALMAMHNYDLTDLYIETFENTDALETAPEVYNSERHEFNTTSNCEVVFKPVSVAGKSYLWYKIDFENASSYEPQLQYSFNNGTNWEYLNTASSGSCTISNLMQASSLKIKVILSGTVTLKNVAFGLK